MGTRAGRSSARALGSLTVLAALLAACGGDPPPASKPPAPAAQGLARFLPLENDTVFSYVTRSEPGGEQGLLVLEVRHVRPELAELVVAGRAQRLNVSESAIDFVAGGSLLREPLREGATFRGSFGRVTVTRTSRRVTVPAGTFEGCLETLEEMTNTEGTKRTTTAFCPGVGIALRETAVEQDAGQGTERLELKSYGKRFTTPGLPPKPE